MLNTNMSLRMISNINTKNTEESATARSTKKRDCRPTDSCSDGSLLWWVGDGG